MDLQQHYNNYTTLLYMRVEPSVWSPPHVKGCCVIVVVLLCRNQTPCLIGQVGMCGIYRCICVVSNMHGIIHCFQKSCISFLCLV